jgi:phosphonopyruvate decarboxylase
VGGVERAVLAALAAPGPHLVHARIAPGSMAKLGRPTISPPEVARRFREFLAAAPPR